MPSESAIVIMAEMDAGGLVAPGLASGLLRPSEARRLGAAMLRDCIERAHHCAGFDTLLAYFPPDRRGEAEEAASVRGAWAEPAAGPTLGARAEGYLRHVLRERAYRSAVLLDPAFPHLGRKAIFDLQHALRGGAACAFGASPDGTVGLLGVRGEVPPGLGDALDAARPSAALGEALHRAGLSPRAAPLPPPLRTPDDLAHLVFDMRADIATKKHAGDDLPLHLLETFDALGLVAALKGDGSVELRRAGPPRI